MKIAVLGTGVVGTTVGDKLVSLGHEVCMGSRRAGSEKARTWAAAAGAGASESDFAGAAAFGEWIFNCTAGVASLEALEMAGRRNLSGKILVDIANPLDFSRGMPPRLTVSNDDSLGEQIQRAFPEARVVKTLNTVNCYVMVPPALVPGDHQLYLCGDDAAAKEEVAEFLARDFGWKRENLIDLGDVTASRATEMMLPLWVRLMMKQGNPWFNFAVVKGGPPA